MHRRTISLAALALALIAAPAQAAPPVEGAPLPTSTVPRSISADYVGVAVIGPRGYCAPDESGNVLCVDVFRPVRWRLWKQSTDGTPFRPSGTVRSSYPHAVLVAPYAPGWHWVVGGPGIGISVLPTRALAYTGLG